MIIYTSFGLGTITQRGATVSVEAGDLVLLNREAEHEVANPGPGRWEYQDVRFRTAGRIDVMPPWRRVGHDLFSIRIEDVFARRRIEDALVRLSSDQRSRDAARAIALPLQIRDLTSASGAAEWHELMAGAMREILILSTEKPSLGRSVDYRVAEALDLMAGSLDEPWDISGVAKAVSVSGSRLIHLFSAHLSISPMRALRLMRMQHAALRLQDSDEPVGLIATESGFGSVFHLSREFRRHYGVSPSEYRKRYRS